MCMCMHTHMYMCIYVYISYLLECTMTQSKMTPKKYMFATGKYVYPDLRQPRKNKMSAKKQYFTINFIHLTHKVCQILSNFTNWCHSFPIYSHCLQCSSCLLLIFPSSSLPFHNISSLVPSTALDIQHFLKPFTVIYGEMCCHAIIHIRVYLFYRRLDGHQGWSGNVWNISPLPGFDP